jgi:hypothetical protein
VLHVEPFSSLGSSLQHVMNIYESLHHAIFTALCLSHVPTTSSKHSVLLIFSDSCNVTVNTPHTCHLSKQRHRSTRHFRMFVSLLCSSSIPVGPWKYRYLNKSIRYAKSLGMLDSYSDTKPKTLYQYWACQTKEDNAVKSRGYFKGPLGMGIRKWGPKEENNVSRR